MAESIKYTLSWGIDESGKIHQQLAANGEILSRWVCDTQDATVRKALAELGWSNPEETKKLKSKSYQASLERMRAMQ